MPNNLAALAVRAAIVTTAAAATTVLGVLPATAVAAPAAPVALAVTPVVKNTHDPAALIRPAVHPPASVGAKALVVALSKIGAPYRYGASGPNAFDCSGLVSWAFKNAGIALPRTSRAQSHVGTPVSLGELRPGDLVFFYKPVSHVGIYIGEGKVVHASRRRSTVKISDVNLMRFHSARRM